MTRIVGADQLHRVVKMALDGDEVATLEEAERLFAGYRVGLAVGPDATASPTFQAAVLTAVTTARRAFLGGVHVAGPLDVPLRVPWNGCRTLDEAVRDLQGTVVDALPPGLPRVVFGDAAPGSGDAGFAIRATYDGWAGGLAPIGDAVRLPEQQDCTPAGVLMGALAVAEAFQHVRGSNAQAGHRSVGLSLWRPEMDWRDATYRGPLLDRLPSRLWLIGLGHLGQASLWTLGFLPYAHPPDVLLVLQDFDELSDANDSTSVLTRPALVGQRKTRAMAAWCEGRGFRTVVNERRFAANFHVDAEEPRVAVCGVDNPSARAVLEQVGFDRVVEAGLGAGPREYLAFRLHTFPGPREAKDLWSVGASAGGVDAPITGRAYQVLAAAGVDECGLTTLAGRTVGAPFVGATVSALVVAELVRLAMGATRYAAIDGSLRSLDHRHALAVTDDTPFNPGWTPAHP